MTKEKWLGNAVAEINKYFSKLGYQVPPVNVSIGFTSYGRRSSTIGECWPKKAASDKRNVIFINPNHRDSEGIISTLAGMAGTIQANEVIKTILNVKDDFLGKILVFNSLKAEFRKIKLSKNPDCIKECTKK